jgi:hypothetical protein
LAVVRHKRDSLKGRAARKVRINETGSSISGNAICVLFDVKSFVAASDVAFSKVRSQRSSNVILKLRVIVGGGNCYIEVRWRRSCWQVVENSFATKRADINVTVLTDIRPIVVRALCEHTNVSLTQ